MGDLASLGDLSKPATTLIEKISDAVGGLAKPWQTVRVAKAEAKAEIIRAESKLTISEIEQRALIRMVHEEGKKQENIESITAKAIPNLSKEAKSEDIDNDWLVHFFERGRLISDQKMQSLWANVLAGEANKPGAFSKKTIELIAVLDKSDAELFTKFCSFVWFYNGLIPILIDEGNSIYSDAGLHFSGLNHLQDIGLINFGGVGGFNLNNMSKKALFHYYGTAIVIEFPTENFTFPLGKALLTRAGKELAPICGSTQSRDYFDYVLNSWMNSGFVLSSPLREKK